MKNEDIGRTITDIHITIWHTTWPAHLVASIELAAEQSGFDWTLTHQTSKWTGERDPYWLCPTPTHRTDLVLQVDTARGDDPDPLVAIVANLSWLTRHQHRVDIHRQSRLGETWSGPATAATTSIA